jgi:hypothetical protein
MIDNLYEVMLKRFFEKLPKDKWKFCTHPASLHFYEGGYKTFLVQNYTLATRYRPQDHATSEEAVENISNLLAEEISKKFRGDDMIYFYKAPNVIDSEKGFMMFRGAGVKNEESK